MKKELRRVLDALVEETKRCSFDARKHDEIMKCIEEVAIKTKTVYSDVGSDYKGEVYEVWFDVEGKTMPILVALYKHADELGVTSEITLAKLFYIDSLGVSDWFRNEVESVEELIAQDLKMQSNLMNYKGNRYLSADRFICRRCGKTLTTPESKERGYGLHCYERHIEEREKVFQKAQITIFEVIK